LRRGKHLDVCLVHQGGRLEGMTGSFPVQLAGGYVPQLRINKRNQPGFCIFIAGTRAVQK